MKLTLASLVLPCLLMSIPLGLPDRSPSSQQGPGIEGVVTDQNGAPVAGAEVVLRNSTQTLRTTSDESGRFKFEPLPEAPLTLTIYVEGFARFEQQLTSTTESAARLNIVLAPASISENVTVSVTRTATRIGENAASIAVLRDEDLKSTAAITVDDALRQVPGFSLFRRSGSRTANPTSQGVSLRGLGASGASRAVVLADGVPLNDPFGGWVYWSRVPRNSIQQVEVLRGGASDLYGSSALSGVVNIITKRPDVNAFALETSFGNQTTRDASLHWSHRMGHWIAGVSAGVFRTDGYILVGPDERGVVDTPAGARHSIVNLNLGREFGENRRLFGSASFFGESRKNGTPLQTNRTHIRQFVLGSDWQSSTIGFLSARLFGGTQVFDQNFTAISLDRNNETLTRVQRVPAQFLGVNGQWTRTFGSKHTLIGGMEANQVRGASDEIVFVAGRATSLVGAGGRQATVGAFLQDLFRVNSSLLITAGVRFDHWRNYDALSASAPFLGFGNTTIFPDRTESAFSPRFAVLYKVTTRVSLTASATRAFRAPTPNELYRSFRVGNVLTLANENLRAERVTSGEGGIRVSGFRERFIFRGNAFWSTVSQPVANVTLTTTPALITRQRQNLGQTRSRGLEIETEGHFNQYWNLSAGYLLADARLLKFPANPALEGLLIPQVARHQFTFQMRYSNPSLVTVGLQGRAASSQFDDDQNVFRLASYFSLDTLVSRRINENVEAFVAVENIFNQRYEVGKTPVTTLGPPILVRGGFRLNFGAK